MHTALQYMAQSCLPHPSSTNSSRSVVAPEHVKGYIYVEAFKQTHVKAAIDGISNLRMGSWSQQMVPIKEMTDVLRVVKEAAGLKVKQWVRIKRGVFKDDLAQVDYVDVASNQVALIPFFCVWIECVHRRHPFLTLA